MTLPTLPQEYIIPKFHGPTDMRVFDDNYLLLFRPTPGGTPIVEGEEGTFQLKDKKDIPQLFKRKYNWTFSRFKEWECFFRFFTFEELISLKNFHYVDFGKYRLHWIVGTGKMRLVEGGNPKTSRFLINISNWCNKFFSVDSLDGLRVVVDKLIELNGYIPINMSSPAATTKDTLLSMNSGEFSIYNKFPFETTRFLHSCYIGPRMESRCLGTIEGVDNIDLEKAYLRALGKCPSMDRNHLLKVAKGAPFDKNAHPGSGYEIEVNVPEEYSQFAPIPMRWQGKTPYPQGKFKVRVTKPYIDLLNELGDIPYTILDSVQLILFGKPSYPFKTFSSLLEMAEKNLKDLFYPINLKALHYPIQGHMLHIHKNTEKNDGTKWYEAGPDYNPVDASAIQGMVACNLWKLSQKNETEAIRVDALSGYNLPDTPGFKRESTGQMTFLTPGLKDKPGDTLYRDLIHSWRDHSCVLVKFPIRYGVADSLIIPSRIGKLVTTTQSISPSQGNRDSGFADSVVGSYPLKRIGRLLDERIRIPIPKNLEGKEPFGPKEEVLYCLDDYLRMFPQTPI